MFEIIFIIIIAVWIANIKKKRANSSGGPGRSIQTPNTTVTTAAQDRRSMGGQHRPLRQTEAKSAIDEAKEDGNSTTAYLMEKAEADAREHAREKYEEQKRLHEASGGLAVAQRLYDGDPVPQGMQCVVCGYCAAENLVPMVPRTRYSCYFCREPL